MKWERQDDNGERKRILGRNKDVYSWFGFLEDDRCGFHWHTLEVKETRWQVVLSSLWWVTGVRSSSKISKGQRAISISSLHIPGGPSYPQSQSYGRIHLNAFQGCTSVGIFFLLFSIGVCVGIFWIIQLFYSEHSSKHTWCYEDFNKLSHNETLLSHLHGRDPLCTAPAHSPWGTVKPLLPILH